MADDFASDSDSVHERSYQPQQRNAANARERARMRVLSKAFCRLKTTLPWVPPDTKLSKLDTLRLATSYIAHLRTVLELSDNDRCQMHPVNMSWPFSFHNNGDTYRPDYDARPDWPNQSCRSYANNNFQNSKTTIRVARSKKKCGHLSQVVESVQDRRPDCLYFKSSFSVSFNQ